MKIYRIAIIGAGASGLMLASLLEDKRGVALIDHNSRVGEKIRVSGGGRCNITNQNISSEHYSGDIEFIETILSRYSVDEIRNFCKKGGYSLQKDERHVEGAMFCKSSNDPIKLFMEQIKGVELLLQREVTSLDYRGNKFTIKTSKGDIFAQKVVVASGGFSYQNIGGSQIGYKIAESFKHKVNRIEPALVGFTVQKDQFWFKELSGLSLSAKGEVDGKSLRGDLLFTHKGCSGPLILNLSLYWKKGQITLDFLPDIDLKSILKGKAKISTTLPLPKKFSKAFLQSIGLEDKNIDRLSQDEVKKLQELKNYNFSPAGNFGFSRAEVTRGGVSTDEIDPKTVESLIQKGLYFIGETLDITGELGGYNFYFAFSSAKVCRDGLEEI